MNRNRNSLAAAILMSFFGAFPGIRRTPKSHMSAWASRSPEEHARRLAAAEAKRDRRRARNLALLRAGQARKGVTCPPT